MVIPWTDDDRRELAELCRAHDELMASAACDDSADLIYKTTETPPDAAEPYPAFDALVQSIAKFVVVWCNEKLAPRDAKISKLEAQVEVLLRLLQKENKSGEVINLPDWRRKDAAPR